MSRTYTCPHDLVHEGDLRHFTIVGFLWENVSGTTVRDEDRERSDVSLYYIVRQLYSETCVL